MSEELIREETAVTKEALARLFEYIGGYWFVTVGPERFSVYNEVRRTNNDVESWHRWFNDRCGNHHQNFWAFIANFYLNPDTVVQLKNSLSF